MNTNNVRLFSLPYNEEKIKFTSYIISWNFKRGFSSSRTSIRRTALLRSFTFQPSTPQLINSLTPKGIFFSNKKRFTVCFSLEEGNSQTPLKSIPVEHREFSIGLADFADNLKNQFINAARAAFIHSSNKAKEKKEVALLGLERAPANKFENSIYTSHTYKYKKSFSKIELNLRQGCQLLTIYVVGSFSWLYLTQYSNKTNLLNNSKMSFLFQEILYKNLPLFSEKGILLDQTIETKNSTGFKKSNLKVQNDQTSSTYLNQDNFKGIQLTPFFHEKLQNFIGKKYVNSEANFSFIYPIPELYFFARKPIGLNSLNPTAFHLPEPKFPIHQSFKKLLTQKRLYNLASTSMRIHPEIDILPRKLNGGYEKIGWCVNKTTSKKLDSTSVVRFKPQLDSDEKVLWCNILIQTKKSNQSNHGFNNNIFQGSYSLHDYKNKTLLQTHEIPKTWQTSNSFRIDKSLEKRVFTQSPLGNDIILIAKPKHPLKQVDSRMVMPFLSDITDTELLKKDLLLTTSVVKKKKILKTKEQKWIELSNQPRLHSGFNFPNASILKKNKSKVKEGLGLNINAQLQHVEKANIALAESKLLNKESQNNVISAEVGPSDPASSSKIKGFLCKNPFLEWEYQQNPELEYLSFNRVHDKKISLKKNSARSIVLDKDNDILINSRSFSREKEEVVKNVFSSKRKCFNGKLDAPENFFGIPQSKLGERFTIEKIKGQNQIGILYNIHNEDRRSNKLTNIIASPYASMGTSLNTVFGKKRFTVPQSNITKTKNFIPNARLVMDWSKEQKKLSRNSGLTILEGLENDPYFFLEKEQKQNKHFDSGNNVKILKLLSFKRLSSKINRTIILPFKYYNPGLSNGKNDDTMLVLEGFKKSRLFPTIHNHYRGIATRGLPIELEIDKVQNNAQDINLQSILGGMRQRTEFERKIKGLNNPSFFFKKKKLSNYYPLLSSLTVSPQTDFLPKVLGSTDLIDSNFRRKDYKGSIQTKGFYFEKLLCSKSVRHFAENGGLISPKGLGKILFFISTWYSYKLLAKPLSQSTQFLPATFTEALGLESFQQKYRIIKGDTGQSFKNIAGAEKTLSELRDLIWTFRLIGTGSPNHKHNFFTLFPYVGSRVGQLRSSVFSKSRNKFLLAGPPGTGKTLLVKALAAEANLPVIVQPVSGLQMISGVENPVSALFEVARQIKPCIIFLDELDTLGNDINVSTSQNAEQQLGIKLARKYTYTLLLELDGLTSSTNDLLIIGATNRLDTLNPALTRAGRFETILDFHLPSQEVRTSLFSFYLSGSKGYQKQTSKHPTVSFEKTAAKSIQLESYLAKKCYGLSHASIGTIVNESALESMHKGASASKSLHTYETLERAINSVKSLTSRATFSIFNAQNDNLLDFANQSPLGSKNYNSTNLYPEVSPSIKLFQQEFLVSKVYQIVGSKLYRKKKKTGMVSDFERPITRFDLHSHLLQEYSGVACLCIYNAAKPQTFHFAAGSGLYQNPSYIAAIILTLKSLSLQSSFFAQDIVQSFNDGNVNSSGRRDHKLLPLSGFISENNLIPLSFTQKSSNLDASFKTPKSILFWNNRKTFKKSVAGNVGFISDNNQPQPLLLDIKASPSKSWFRIYLSRPFFCYDTPNYIENREYYPRNNYLLKRNTQFLRNVSTLSHETIYIQSGRGPFGPYTPTTRPIKKGKFLKEKQLTSKRLFSGPSNLQNLKLQSKESLYLAIVAKIFHQNIQFFKTNRELTDYCAYTFLRYGMLYEFYLEAIIKRF